MKTIRHCAALPRPSSAVAKSLRRAAALVILSMLTVSVFAETVSIDSASDWAVFANRVNAGETTLDATLAADVSLNPASRTPPRRLASR